MLLDYVYNNWRVWKCNDRPFSFICFKYGSDTILKVYSGEIYHIRQKRVPLKLLNLYKNQFPILSQEIDKIKNSDHLHQTGRKNNYTGILEPNLELKFGVEIEFINREYSLPSIVEEFNDNAIPIDYYGYTHLHQDQWKFVSDSSLSWGGYELVSPPLNDFKDLKLACDILEYKNCTADISCGLHVHVNINKNKLLAKYASLFYIKNQNLINSILPKSRINNRFCKELTERQLSRNLAVASRTKFNPRSRGRYYNINVYPLNVYGTIEFRQHSGTVQFEKIKNWTKICLAIVDYVNNTKPIISFNTLKEMLIALEVDNDVIAWAQKRQLKFINK